MNRFMLNLGFSLTVLTLGLVSCNSSEEAIIIPPPSVDDAQFTFSFDPENENRVLFTAETSVDTWFTHWNFGDNTASEGLEVDKLYPISGTYEVKFKIFTEGGQAFTTQELTIEKDLIGPNIVANGSVDDASSWTLLPISGGVEVLFENGKAIWTGGGWGHAGIYQSLEIEGGKTYQIEMNVSGSGMSDCWFEVYIGEAMPTAGVDYNDGGIRLGLNTWDGCGAEAFDGPLSLLSCSASGGDGTFSYESEGEVYLVIRSGGASLGDDGVSIDDITIRGF